MPITMNETVAQEMKEIMLKYLPERLDVPVGDVHIASISVLCGIEEEEKLKEVTVYFNTKL